MRSVRNTWAHVIGTFVITALAGSDPTSAQRTQPAHPPISQADNDKARDLNNAAAALHNARNYQQALALYGRVITLNPYAAVYYNNRAAARDQVGDLAGALSDYDTALRLDPKPAVFYNNRASLLLKRDDVVHALADYDRAVKAEPKTGFFHQERAKALLRKGDVPAAVAEFRSAYRLDPKLTGARDTAAALEATPAPPPKIEPPPRGDGPGRRVALVVGNANYVAQSQLINPKFDAEAMTGALKALGFSVETIVDATQGQMLAALDRFGVGASKADWAVVFFSGHGLEAAGVNYLAPTDLRLGDDAELQAKTVSLDRVLSSVQRARKLGLVILDACRNAPPPPNVKRTVETHAVARGLASPNLSNTSGVLVAYATEHGQVSFDGQAGASSPYTGALARRLTTPGLEVDRLFRLVRDDVLAATDSKQRPYVYGSIPSEPLYFRPVQP